MGVDGWSGDWQAGVTWRPASLTAAEFSREGWGEPKIPYRIVEGRLRLENIPEGEPVVLTLEFSAIHGGAYRTWRATLAVQLEGADLKPIQPTWVESK